MIHRPHTHTHTRPHKDHVGDETEPGHGRSWMLKGFCVSIIDQKIQYEGPYSAVCYNRTAQVGGCGQADVALKRVPQGSAIQPLQILKVQKGTVWDKVLGIFSEALGFLVKNWMEKVPMLVTWDKC